MIEVYADTLHILPFITTKEVEKNFYMKTKKKINARLRWFNLRLDVHTMWKFLINIINFKMDWIRLSLRKKLLQKKTEKEKLRKCFY